MRVSLVFADLLACFITRLVVVRAVHARRIAARYAATISLRVIFSFVLVSFSDEIYAYVDIDASEEVVGRELFAPVVVGVQDCACAGIPSGVVPNDAESSDSVEA